MDRDSLIIGRASTSDLALPDPFLSRHHARLFRQGDRILVEDLGSRNGTQLNGSPVLEPTPVRAGDVLRVSGSVISFFDQDDSSTREPISDFGATILRSASDLLREVTTIRKPEQVESQEELRDYAQRLRLINEIHETLSTSISVKDLLQLILDRAFDHLRPEQGVIFLKRAGDYERAATHTAPGATQEIPLSRALVEEVCDKGMAALVMDTATDERFSAAQSIITSGLRSLIAAPLLDAAGSLGMVVLTSKATVREFSQEDLELLVSLASIAALKIRNAALTEEAIERQKMERDLTLARRIQESMLPRTLPEFSGFQLLAQNIPSRGVSGDYYQVLTRHGDSECVLLVCDVSGKGMPAALLTTSLEALAAAPIEDGFSTEEICAKVSRRLHRRSPPEKYATAFLAVIRRDQPTLQFTNAGHNPALLIRRDGGVEQLGSSGMPLGLIAEATFTQHEVAFDPGDTLVVYTDGITEAENPDEEEFGLERLVNVARENRTASLPELSTAINRDLEKFARGVPFADDRTLVITRRL
ncbi:MAG TPA: SpoIIE family protein phosphatase [Thermoanaerobaculia bacterium]|nr:SpoIIE family protein phosphatase [Thermoanaerobaculia bacterium]